MEKIENWIYEDNLFPILNCLGLLCEYKMDEYENDLFISRISDTAENKICNFEFKGKSFFEISIYRESGQSTYEISVKAPKDYKNSIETILTIGQHFRLIPIS